VSIDRRRFLQLTVAGLAALTGGACRGGGGAADELALARPALIDVLGDSVVREIGTRYRSAVPREGDAAALKAAILGPPGGGLRLPWAERPPLAERVRDDFAAGRTVLVNGWLLSVTEARQCALYSLAST
jgi:hypothetical protein